MKLGFIGAGNMAGAIMEGVLKKGVLAPEDVHIFDVSETRMAQMQEKLGVTAHKSCADMLKSVDVALLAVKPNVAKSVLREQFDSLCGKALISIAAGWTVSMLRKEVSADTRILRRDAEHAGAGRRGHDRVQPGHTLTEGEFAFAKSVFESLGRLVCVHEYQMEAVIGLSGSGPAYAYMFIEALADGGAFLRTAARTGARNGRADAAGQRENGAGKRHASRRTEGHGLLAGRHDDRRGAFARGRWFPRKCRGRRDRGGGQSGGDARVKEVTLYTDGACSGNPGPGDGAPC
jgi:pyrroline-5-carboxylate reductase